MAKRFTDTNIWKNQKWFKRLSPIHKLFWKYLTDSCDHAGVWKIDYLAITEDLGIEDFSLMEFVTSCNQDFEKLTGKPIEKTRVLIIKDSAIWLTGFMQFQYENKMLLINPKVAVVKSALDILKGFGILQEGLDKGYIRLTEPLDKGLLTLKDKDKDKDNCIKTVEENKDSNGVCHEMLLEFKKVNTGYQHDNDDLRQLLDIANKIAVMHRWPKHSIVAENRSGIVADWVQIVARVRGDPFYGTKDIAFLNKDWKSLMMKIQQPVTQRKRQIEV